MAKKIEKDILLDHDYDGIKELDNRLPPWWVYLFYITIIWAVLYMIHYHVTGTGDSSYVEYMKEMDPDWQPDEAESGLSIGYRSPFYAASDLTPRKRIELELAKQAEAKTEQSRGVESMTAANLNFEQLILAAMEVSSIEDLEKLKTAFPAIYQQYQEKSGAAVAAPVEEPAVSEPDISPLTDDASLAAGKSIFEINCATCHGKLGEGGIGPNMTDNYYIHGAGVANTVKVIKNGVAAKGMISWRGILKEEEILQVASYILSLKGTNPPKAKAPQGEKIVPEN